MPHLEARLPLFVEVNFCWITARRGTISLARVLWSSGLRGKVLSNQTASPYIHQATYGGDVNLGYEYGLDWYDLTETTITVHRRKDDPNWCQVRIIIRKLPERLMPREEQAKNGHN
jgi:hypothetical protein